MVPTAAITARPPITQTSRYALAPAVRRARPESGSTRSPPGNEKHAAVSSRIAFPELTPPTAFPASPTGARAHRRTRTRAIHRERRPPMNQRVSAIRGAFPSSPPRISAENKRLRQMALTTKRTIAPSHPAKFRFAGDAKCGHGVDLTYPGFVRSVASICNALPLTYPPVAAYVAAHTSTAGSQAVETTSWNRSPSADRPGYTPSCSLFPEPLTAAGFAHPASARGSEFAASARASHPHTESPQAPGTRGNFVEGRGQISAR